VGERALLREVLRKLRAAAPDERLLVSAGDDAAALLLPAGEAAVLTTDTLVEGTHFRRPWTAAQDLGWKLVMSAASDVSAMGGRPLAAVVAISAPPAMTAAEFLALMAGAELAAKEARLLLTGGDTTASAILVLTATVLGTAPPQGLVRRSGAQVGDLVAVTGVLGEAGAGLGIVDKLFGEDPSPDGRWLRAESPLAVIAERLGERGFDAPAATALAEAARRFLRPSPPFAAGPVMATGGATALIDVSDGLASEATWIAEESGVGIVIDAARVPLGAGARAWASYRGLDPITLAFGGGEDYELLLTVPESAWSDLERRLRAIGIWGTVIGTVLPESEGVTWRGPDGFRRPLGGEGYEHFAPPA
jgi:thiamine-monophosphate kinase